MNKRKVLKLLSMILAVILVSSSLFMPVYPLSEGRPVQWSPGTYYDKDTQVTFEENIFKCLLNHTSTTDWQPSTAPALWTKVEGSPFFTNSPTPTPTLYTPTINSSPLPSSFVEITSPTGNKYFRLGHTVDVKVSVGSSTDVEKVEYYGNYGEKIGESTQSPFDFSFVPKAYPHYYEYQITAKAIYKSGESCTSKPVKIIIVEPQPTSPTKTATPTPTATPIPDTLFFTLPLKYSTVKVKVEGYKDAYSYLHFKARLFTNKFNTSDITDISLYRVKDSGLTLVTKGGISGTSASYYTDLSFIWDVSGVTDLKDKEQFVARVKFKTGKLETDQLEVSILKTSESLPFPTQSPYSVQLELKSPYNGTPLKLDFDKTSTPDTASTTKIEMKSTYYGKKQVSGMKFYIDRNGTLDLIGEAGHQYYNPDFFEFTHEFKPSCFDLAQWENFYVKSEFADGSSMISNPAKVLVEVTWHPTPAPTPEPTPTLDHTPTPTTLPPYNREYDYDAKRVSQSSGVVINDNYITGCDDGDWVVFKNARLGYSGPLPTDSHPADSYSVDYSIPDSYLNNTYVEFRRDKPDGPLLSSVKLDGSYKSKDRAYDSQKNYSYAYTCDLYIVFKNVRQDHKFYNFSYSCSVRQYPGPTVTPRPTPTLFKPTPISTPLPLHDIVGISAGFEHSIALDKDGRVFNWGNDYSSYSLERWESQRYIIKNIPLTAAGPLKAGFKDSMAFDSSKNLWCWGYINLPPYVMDAVKNGTACASGKYHKAFLKDDGTVWSWQSNVYGQLGDGTNEDSSMPVKASGLSGIMQISAGQGHTLALNSDGMVCAWGQNSFGQLGDSSTENQNKPVIVKGIDGAIAVSGGGGHSLILKKDGTVWATGSNYFGQLGDGSFTDSKVPVEVKGLGRIVKISAGSMHSLALREDGRIFAWGSNEYGKLGRDNSLKVSNLPLPVDNISDVKDISAGGNHSLALKNDGTVWAWGSNSFNQLGNHSFTDSFLPVRAGGPGNTVVTPSPTPTPTKDRLITISGFVCRGDNSEIDPKGNFRSDFTIDAGQGTYCKSDNEGHFTLYLYASQMPARLKITKFNYLTRYITIDKIENCIIGTYKNPIPIYAGDIDLNGKADGSINMLDIMQISKFFGKVNTDLEYIHEIDFNYDGAINMSDILIVAKSFNKTTSDYPDIAAVAVTPTPTPAPSAQVTPEYYVNTGSASEITGTSAVLSGSISLVNCYNSFRFFYYEKNEPKSIKEISPEELKLDRESGYHRSYSGSARIRDLKPGTAYVYFAGVYGNPGGHNGREAEFTTLP